MSYELRVYELRVKSVSWNSNPRVKSSKPRITSSNPWVVSSNPRVQESLNH